jgi:AraC-like DNA-binding protein
MQKHLTTLFDKCKVAAQATIDLINHRQTPDRISDAVIETLIEMSAETLLQIWNKETGINVITLAGLYSLQKRGAGRRRVRLYSRYEVGRLERKRKELRNREQS